MQESARWNVGVHQGSGSIELGFVFLFLLVFSQVQHIQPTSSVWRVDLSHFIILLEQRKKQIIVHILWSSFCDFLSSFRSGALHKKEVECKNVYVEWT